MIVSYELHVDWSRIVTSSKYCISNFYLKFPVGTSVRDFVCFSEGGVRACVCVGVGVNERCCVIIAF